MKTDLNEPYGMSVTALAYMVTPLLPYCAALPYVVLYVAIQQKHILTSLASMSFQPDSLTSVENNEIRRNKPWLIHAIGKAGQKSLAHVITT